MTNIRNNEFNDSHSKEWLNYRRNPAVIIGEASVCEDTRVYPVEVEDIWTNHNFEAISSEVDRLMSMGFWGDSTINLARKRKSSIDKSNPATRELIERYPGFEAWLDTVPRAEALDPIYNPGKGRLPNGSALGAEAQQWFKNIFDGIGIRSRASVMKEIIRGEISRRSGEMRWVSLASGAAQPVFESMQEIADNGGEVPRTTLLDVDGVALRHARERADRLGFGENITTVRANILRREGLTIPEEESRWAFHNRVLSRMRGGLTNKSFGMVDAVGILEYLKEDDWNYTYNGVIKTRKKMAGAVTFLRNAYDLVEPGGVLLVGNMRDSHPQLGFTMNVIQWPHIQPRSIENMVSIINKAGLDGEVDIYCPSDNVYAIYAIRRSD